MKLLVLGRSGQLAQALAERAAGRGFNFVAIGRPNVDLRDASSVAAAIAAAAPEAVVNAAAYTAVDAAEDEEGSAFAINAQGAGEAARASAEAGVPFVHISTDYVFDGSGSEPRDEFSPTAPLGAYGRSKLAGEQSVRAAHPGALILRTAWVYGPFASNFVRTMMNAAKQRDELRVVADQRGNPTSALDLADGILATLRLGGGRDGGLFHLAGAGTASWAELAQATMDECRRLGLPAATIVPIPSSQYPTKARRPLNSMLDSRRFQERFQFTMPPWRESLRPVVERLARQ